MLCLEVDAPLHGILELLAGLFEKFHCSGVGNALEVGFQNVVQSLEKALVHEFVEELHLLGSVLQGEAYDVFDHVFHDLHVAFQVAESHLGLDHPELGGVACGVGVFSSEGGSEGVHVSESQGEDLRLQLAGYGQVHGLAEEIHLAVLCSGDVVQVQGGHSEHLACALSVGTGDDGCVNVYEASLLEELMDGVGHHGAHSEHSAEHVCSGPQIGDLSQVFHGVSLGLQRIVGSGSPFHHHFSGLDLEGLLSLRRKGQDASDGKA